MNCNILALPVPLAFAVAGLAVIAALTHPIG